MKKPWSKPKTLSWIASACFLCCAAFFFLPVLGEKLEDGSRLAFSSAKLLFGGSQSTVVSGITYSYDFKLNLYFLIILQAFLLGALASIIGRNEKRTRILGLAFGGAGLIASVLLPSFAAWNNPGLLREGLVRMWGCYLIYAFGSVGTASIIASFFL